MTRGRRPSLLASLFFVLLFTVASVHAAEEGSNAANENAAQMFKWINFAVLVVVLWLFFQKIAIPYFRRNAEAIGSAIAKSTAAKAEADRQLREAETKLASLEQEVKQLRVTAVGEAKAEAERIRNGTQSDIAKIGVAAKAEIAAAERAARLELKAIAANLAVDGAESLLAKQLTPQAQESLVANFVETLEGRPN
jgi:F-type H+-transporting ATPase subunit b